MAPRLSGQTFIFGVVFFVSKSLLGIEGQKKLEKFAILTRKPRSHARILIYRTWPIWHNMDVQYQRCAYGNSTILLFSKVLDLVDAYDVRTNERTYARTDLWTVTTKFFEINGLPNFLRYRAPLAHPRRAGALLLKFRWYPIPKALSCDAWET